MPEAPPFAAPQFAALPFAMFSMLSAASAAALDAPPSSDAPTAESVEPPRLTEAPAPVDYNAPAGEITLTHHLRALANLAFQSWAVWQLSWFRGEGWTLISRDSLADNLKLGFAFDQDELGTNFFGHPYHGGLMFTAARGVGLSFWTSATYTAAGAFIWEVFAENEPPSINDLVMTTLSGWMLGEITYRLSSELLDDGASGSPRLLRELGAAAISPMRGWNRLYGSEAWRHGPPPIRRRVEAALHVGIDAVRSDHDESPTSYGPSLLLAADVRYGSVSPLAPSDRIRPLTFFELYAGINLFDSELQGAQVYSTGLLYGWGHGLRNGTGSNVFGFATTYEFQGSNLVTYGGVGLGPADYLTIGMGKRRSLRIGAGVDVVPVLGITSGFLLGTERGYKFGAGTALWGSVVLDLARAGALRLRSRQYATATLDGASGVNYLGATRLSYEVDALGHVGFGVAPMVIYRRLQGEPDGNAFQLQAQLFVRLHN